MKIDLVLLLLFRIESCHQVVTQLWDRVKVMWHMRKGFAVVGEFWCWVLLGHWGRTGWTSAYHGDMDDPAHQSLG